MLYTVNVEQDLNMVIQTLCLHYQSSVYNMAFIVIPFVHFSNNYFVRFWTN